MIGFDYTDYIPAAALEAAGCSVVFRYLSNPGWPKNLTKAEAAELLAAGIPIVLNYETTADFMLSGYSGGQACARSARAQAAALGAPGWTRIYYSGDFDVTAAQLPIVMDFLKGAASVDGPAEVDEYGGLRLAQAAAAAGMRPWQTVAWSGGVWDPRDVARQTGQQLYVNGVQVDVNVIEDLAALGAWGGPTTGGTVILGQDDLEAQAAANYNFGKESVNLPGGKVMQNVPLGNLAHGAWVSTNDPVNGPVLLSLARIEAAVGTLKPMDPAPLAAAIVADLQAAGVSMADSTAIATAVASALEQHNLGGTSPAALSAALDAASASLKAGA